MYVGLAACLPNVGGTGANGRAANSVAADSVTQRIDPGQSRWRCQLGAAEPLMRGVQPGTCVKRGWPAWTSGR